MILFLHVKLFFHFLLLHIFCYHHQKCPVNECYNPSLFLVSVFQGKNLFCWFFLFFRNFSFFGKETWVLLEWDSTLLFMNISYRVPVIDFGGVSFFFSLGFPSLTTFFRIRKIHVWYFKAANTTRKQPWIKVPFTGGMVTRFPISWIHVVTPIKVDQLQNTLSLTTTLTTSFIFQDFKDHWKFKLGGTLSSKKKNSYNLK